MLRPVTVSEAVIRVLEELQRMGISQEMVLISTNLRTRLDGLPLSNQAAPVDPGVAVYWQLPGERKCIAIDLYDQVAQNLAAVAASLEAIRAIERHGGAEIMDRAFSGFTALPEKSSLMTWMVVMDLPAEAPMERIHARYLEMAKTRHPNAGGSREGWDQLQEAYHQAREAKGWTQ